MLFSEQPEGVIEPLQEAALSGKGETAEVETVPGEDNEITASTLSTRAKNALSKNGISSMSALRALSNEQIENIEGLGKKTITEIIEFLGR